jgi:GcrA cell cycle regulator
MADMTKPKKPKTKPKTVDTLERYDCRWPIGDPRHADFHFCGAPQLLGRPYCELHWRMAFQPMKSKAPPSFPSASSSRRAA